ncbi:hypothetical protein EDB81DRAFT_810252 [Dactylonectria macrodidyma]|uniref:NAD-dependent epimerase/dehydratase domain-containing protein n=1 Tax=Dactylonectria macrodidyma TaxID=307937 RepID=A0A9P9INY6_9HYPO|nr:hypothetical protein EDB81DRAFT_810252 [Dactylonectria macrodidyma]
MDQPRIKILLTGATGYLGGSVLTSLIQSANPVVKNLKISALVRGATQAELLAGQTIRPILFSGFEDIEALTKAASEHDAVINCASGFATGAAEALILGLGERRKLTGQEVFMIHTSGTSNISDRPISKKYVETRSFDDATDNIFEYLVERQSLEVYEQRTTDLAVAKRAKETGVKVYTIMAPPIYGIGTGKFNRLSTQIPMLAKIAIQARRSLYIGDGLGVKDYVHVVDLAKFYGLLLGKVLENGRAVPYGERGIFFASTGSFRWKDLAKDLAQVGYDLGKLDSPEPRSITIDEALALGIAATEQRAELVFASNSRGRASVANSLGWTPKKTETDWKNNLKDDFVAVIRSLDQK